MSPSTLAVHASFVIVHESYDHPRAKSWFILSRNYVR